MTKPKIKIVNAETGEEIEREMNSDELAQLQIDQVSAQAEKNAAIAQVQAKQAILDKLGITVEEAAALLG